MIKIVQSNVSEAVGSCSLVPSLAGMVIEVPAGTVRFNGVGYILTEAEDFTVVAASDIGGWLVETAEGEVHLLIYFWPHDGSGVAFDPSNYPTLKFLHLLFLMYVPSGTTSLEALELKVFHLVETSAEPLRESEI